MTADILAVMWKERRGLLLHRGSRKRAMLTVLFPVIMMSVYFPWQIGADWVHSPLSFLAAALVPMILVGTAIPESFAGERERHTLETLLASRLPDRAILYGKMAVAVGFAWLAGIVVLFLGLIVVNIVHWEGYLMLYPPGIALGNLALGLIVAILGAGAGVVISLRAATVQEAQQILMSAIMFPPLLLGVVMTVVVTANEGWLATVRDLLGHLSSWQGILAVLAILVALDLVLLRWAAARFQRGRLILH
jgi:ABC-2 type transport system permease protein